MPKMEASYSKNNTKLIFLDPSQMVSRTSATVRDRSFHVQATVGQQPAAAVTVARRCGFFASPLR